MRVLVLGADGFVGRSVANELSTKHKVIKANRKNDKQGAYIDLLKKDTIAEALLKYKPEAIVNCAGVVENTETAKQNYVFTSNLLTEVLRSNLPIRNIIISGSAAEYGLVSEFDLPVKETTPLNANSLYGQSKLRETSFALEFAKKHNLPITIARIFNPIGVGMHPRFLVARITEQIREIHEGKRRELEISRLDAKRDYVHVSDVARAIKLLLEGIPKESTYNIGSGVSTSNGELVNLIIAQSNLSHYPKTVETSPDPEPLVAVQADITRLIGEFGWKPRYTIKDAIKEIISANR